ncbi:MAG: DNA polymerase III subunit beta [Desulfobacterota bacterium]|nr:DNA polymerase III subunit beta [Thermodesulfobacteriota bacterium]
MSYFEIQKKDFLRGLGLMQGIAGRKTTLPILSHIFLEWKEDSLFLTGTDLQTGIQEALPAKVHQNGKASVSSKKLYEIIRELPEETIHIQKRENHWIQLRCGKSLFNLAGLDPEDFPSLPTWQDKPWSTHPLRTVREMIEKTVFAASNEESRYHLNGILFVQRKAGGKETLRMVATDGHRLSLIDREAPTIPGIGKGVILPKKGILEIKKILGDKEEVEEVGIGFDPTHAFFKLGSSLMVIRLIDGEFPDYEQVIPKENDKSLVMKKDLIYGSLKRVATMASERSEGIKLSIKRNVMELSSYHQDFGDAKEEVEIEYEGPPLEIGFNARYLMEAIQSFDVEEVLFELKDDGSPGVLRPYPPQTAPQHLNIIMPMRM